MAGRSVWYDGAWVDVSGGSGLAIPTSGLHMRLRADEITGLSNGDPVATWPDISGNGRDATQATSGKRPTWQSAGVNGRPAVRFTLASSQYMATASWTELAQPNTVVVVASISASSYICDGIADGYRHAIFAISGMSIFAGSSVSGSVSMPAAASVWTGVYNGASSLLRRNGTTVASGNAGTNGLTGLTIGSRFNGAQNSNDYICEVLVYDRLLTSDERALVEGLLIADWGLSST